MSPPAKTRPRGRVLFLAQLAPPSLVTAARRTAGLARYLDRLGYQVTLVTSLVAGRGEGVPGAARTIRTRDLMVSRLNWRRRSFSSFSSVGEGRYSSRPSRLARWIPPDLGLVGWVPFALARAWSLADQSDCVVTSGPPHSTHLIGYLLRRRGIPWIAELRDGWTFQSNRPRFSLPALRAVDALLERACVRAADGVVAVTDPIAEDLAARFGVHAVTITNGFDPEEAEQAVVGAAVGLLDAHRHSIVYTGSLAYGGRSPEPLLDGLRELRRRAPHQASRLEIVFAGPITDDERSIIQSADLDGAVRAVGMLDRPTVLALQRAADGLVVVTNGDSGMATGKLYEYLAAGRPVLVLGEGTAAARIVERARAGFATSASDPRTIASALERLQSWRATRDDAAVRRHSYELLARRLSDQIELVRTLTKQHERHAPVGAREQADRERATHPA